MKTNCVFWCLQVLFCFAGFDFHHVVRGFSTKPQLYSLRSQYLFTVVYLVLINCDSPLRHCICTAPNQFIMGQKEPSNSRHITAGSEECRQKTWFGTWQGVLPEWLHVTCYSVSVNSLSLLSLALFFCSHCFSKPLNPLFSTWVIYKEVFCLCCQAKRLFQRAEWSFPNSSFCQTCICSFGAQLISYCGSGVWRNKYHSCGLNLVLIMKEMW